MKMSVNRGIADGARTGINFIFRIEEVVYMRQVEEPKYILY
jgi:hypothetical protein